MTRVLTGKIACHGMLRFISYTNLCIRKFLDLKRCNSVKSRHRSEILFFQLFEQAFFRRAQARRTRREGRLSLTQISFRLRRQEIWVRGYLTISMGKPGITFGLRHFAWETSENMACDFWQRNFSNVVSLFS